MKTSFVHASESWAYHHFILALHSSYKPCRRCMHVCSLISSITPQVKSQFVSTENKSPTLNQIATYTDNEFQANKMGMGINQVISPTQTRWSDLTGIFCRFSDFLNQILCVWAAVIIPTLNALKSHRTTARN